MFIRGLSGAALGVVAILITSLEATATAQTERNPIVASGRVESQNSVNIISRLPGQSVVLALAPEGSIVAKGDVIAELDTSDLEEARASAQLAVERANATRIQRDAELDMFEGRIRVAELEARILRLSAEIDLEEATRVLADLQAKVVEGQPEPPGLSIASARQSLAKMQLELAEVRSEEIRTRVRGELRSAEADRRSADRELALAKERLDFLRHAVDHAVLKSPVEGMLVYPETRRNGDVMEAGTSVRERQLIARVVDPNRIRVSALVKESDIGSVREGQAVQVRSNDQNGRAVEGRITRVSPVPMAKSARSRETERLFPILVSIQEDATPLRIGMAVDLQIAR